MHSTFTLGNVLKLTILHFCWYKPSILTCHQTCCSGLYFFSYAWCFLVFHKNYFQFPQILHVAILYGLSYCHDLSRFVANHHSVHWGINAPSKMPPPSFLPNPPLNPLFRQSSPLNWFFVNPPPVKVGSFSEPQTY